MGGDKIVLLDGAGANGGGAATNGLLSMIPGMFANLIGVDILPRLKAMGFLDTNVWNPGISTAGITHTLQFGNALPKNVFRC